ncbi:MAG TPA: glucose-1-phosphate adenylyltransferase [Candidatus Acidoferrales bacterium]|nr:glucose-1-phosphate adenylyltransferase [Candidatus Acidoferrales bacterium]
MQIESSQRFISLVTKDTLALILAGGRGSRLGELTSHRAKPAVPFGGKFRIIDFPLSNCINSGIRRVGVVTQYMAHSLIRHMQQGWGFLRGEFGEFIEILPAQQRHGEAWYKGTADAVYQNIEIIRMHRPRYVLILGGDHVYKMDYGTMLGFHVSHEADVTVACLEVPRAEATGFGIMGVSTEGRVESFVEKPSDPPAMPNRPDHALASMGIYVFNTDYLLRVLAEDGLDPDSNHDFGKDILPGGVARGERIFAFPFRNSAQSRQAYWRDVGTIDSYWAANMELIGVTPELDLYDETWPIWTYQEQAPPAKFVFDDEDRRGIAIDSMLSGGCIVSGAVVRHSLLFSNVLVAERTLIQDTVVLPRAVIGPDCLVRKAVIETGCHLPPGTVIGEDPIEDARRFHVTEGGVVLVTPEMLQQELPYVR